MKKSSGFTLMEVVIVVIVIGILAWITVGTLKSQGLKNQQTCINNLNRISAALEQYYRDNNRSYPPDDQSLAVSLAAYNLPNDTFICPVDLAPGYGGTDSYIQFYAQRSRHDNPTSYRLGCPRHGNKAMNLFFAGAVDRSITKTVTDGANSVEPGDSVDALVFADGSTVTKADGGGSITLFQSFDRGGGTCYSVVKINPPADIIFDVPTEGSRLEMITPSGIAGVRGTRGVVLCSATETVVAVDEGTVNITNPEGKTNIRRAKWGGARVNAAPRPHTPSADEVSRAEAALGNAVGEACAGAVYGGLTVSEWVSQIESIIAANPTLNKGQIINEIIDQLLSPPTTNWGQLKNFLEANGVDVDDLLPDS